MKTYTFGSESEIRIAAHAPLHTTHAAAEKVEGEFSADLADGTPKGEVTGYAEVEVKAFKSGNRLLEMNTLRHIGAKKYPKARFEIGEVEVIEAGDPVTVRVSGEMEFHGVTVEISAEPTLEIEDDTLTIAGSWTLTQSEFGLKPPRLAMLKVDDDIAVDFSLVARPVS